MNTTNPSSPALLTSVLTATQNGVLVYQAIRTDSKLTDLRLTMCNAVAEQDMGRPALEAVGQSFTRLIPHLAETGLLARYGRVIETGLADRFELEYTRPGQSESNWCDVSVVRLTEDSLVVSYDNITHIKANAQAARQSIVLQQAFDVSVNGIAVFEAVRDNGSGPITDFRFVMINKAGLNMSGFTREELLGHTLWEIYPATGTNGLFSQYVAVCETGQPFIGDHYYPEYDIWREESVVPVPNGVMVSYNDITTRHKSEETAHQQTQFVENLLESIPVGIAVMNAIRSPDGQLIDFWVVRVNSVLQDIFCLSPDQLLGRTLTVAFAFAGASGLLSRSIASVELGDKQSFEMPFGSRQNAGWYRVSMVPQGDQVILAVTDISDSRRAQLAHHQEAELLQSVLHASHDSIVAVDALFDDAGLLKDFAYVMMNRAGETAINRRLEDIRGRGMLEVFPAIRESDLFDSYRQVWETGQPHRVEKWYDADGVMGWFLLSIVRRGPGLLITVTDTTGLNQARQQAEQQAELLQSVLDGSQNAIIAFDAIRDETGQLTDLRYVMQNAANEARVGCSDAQLVGHTMLEFFPSVRDNGMLAQYAGVIGTGVPMRTEVTFDYGQGKGWYDLSVVRRGDGIVLTVMDITEQHNSQINQKQQADTFNSVLSHMMHGMTVLRVLRDKTGKLADLQYEYISEQVVHDTGLSQQQYIGSTVLTLFPDIKESRIWKAYVEALETGEAQLFENHYHYDGFDNYANYQVACIDENRLVATYQIVNELKRKQQALEVLNMELRRSNENLQQFAYIASHDLQEPLRKIQSFGDMLISNYVGVLDENGRDMIARMQKAAKRMSNLIRDLLNYSRVSTEREPFEPVSLSQLLTSLVDDLLVAVKESGAVIDWDDLPVIMGDRTQLRQLFQNLLSNALKFGVFDIPPRISVTHRVLSSAALPSSVVGATRAAPTTDDGKAIDRFYEINVTDNGIGFDEKYVDRIFQLFQRLHGKNEYVGTGLGLAICRKVVENHRGAITATSQPGVGTTFHVYLPVVVA